MGSGVGQRQQDVNQGDAVGVTVMDPQDHGAAVLIILDQMELPHRFREIQRGAHQIAGQVLQLGLVGPARQRGTQDMPIEVEMRIDLPESARRFLDRPLPESLILQKARLHDLPQPVMGQALGKDHDSGDHHQVGGTLHAQPGGIDPRHGLALLFLGHKNPES